jgi:hypothetical protein
VLTGLLLATLVVQKADEYGQCIRWDPPVTPAAVEAAAKSPRAQYELGCLFRDNKAWAKALKGVESGSSEWLITARQLNGFADGGAAEELSISLSVALTRAPAKVLDIVGYDETVCGNFEGAQTRQEAVRLLDAQEQAVKAVGAPRLAAARLACLVGIQNARGLVPKGP